MSQKVIYTENNGHVIAGESIMGQHSNVLSDGFFIYIYIYIYIYTVYVCVCVCVCVCIMSMHVSTKTWQQNNFHLKIQINKTLNV